MSLNLSFLTQNCSVLTEQEHALVRVALKIFDVSNETLVSGMCDV